MRSPKPVIQEKARKKNDETSGLQTEEQGFQGHKRPYGPDKQGESDYTELHPDEKQDIMRRLDSPDRTTRIFFHGLCREIPGSDTGQRIFPDKRPDILKRRDPLCHRLLPFDCHGIESRKDLLPQDTSENESGQSEHEKNLQKPLPNSWFALSPGVKSHQRDPE